MGRRGSNKDLGSSRMPPLCNATETMRYSIHCVANKRATNNNNKQSTSFNLMSIHKCSLHVKRATQVRLES